VNGKVCLKMLDDIVLVSSAPQYSELATLWNQTNWGAYTETQFRKIHAGNEIIVCARKKGRLVGYGRLLSDRVMYGYVQDLIVAKDLRGMGVGEKLLNYLTEKGKECGLQFIGLFSTLDAEQFYIKQGFSDLSGKNVGLGIYL